MNITDPKFGQKDSKFDFFGDQHSAKVKYKGIPLYDLGYVLVILTLLAFGFMMVYSATIPYPSPVKHRLIDVHISVRYLCFVFLSILVFFVVSRMPLRWFKHKNMIRIMVVLTILSCLAVFVPGIGATIKGASRWVRLGPVNFQPSELAKLSLIVFSAYFLDQLGSRLETSLNWIGRFSLVVLPIVLIVLLQKDLGGTLVLLMIVTSMLLLGGFPFRYILLVLLVVSIFVVFAVVFEPYRFARVATFINPLDDDTIHGSGYQLAHSWQAIVQGGFWGQGLGGSIEKLNYLPEAHTDFIMAIVTEELGVPGVLFVIVMFYILIYKILSIGKDAAIQGERFHAYIAYGVGIWFFCQVSINLGVYTGVLPTKGLALPLISYGGSAIVVNMLALALVLRVDIENRCLMRGETVYSTRQAQVLDKGQTWKDFQS